jgi:hypothetical protein
LRRTAIIEGGAGALVVFAGLSAAWVMRGRDSAERPKAPVAMDKSSPSPAASPPLAAVLSSPASSPSRASPASAPPSPVDESAMMAHLRRIRDADPAAAVDLARQGNHRFPESPDAPERTSILIHALASQGRASEARGEAEDMVNRYPDSSWVQEVERFTGAHRHRNIRLTEAGNLEYY